LTLAYIEKHLVKLRKQQRDKIEEIKKNTNYYSTRTLLERYDDFGTPIRKPSSSNGIAMQPLQRLPKQQPLVPQQQLAQLPVPQTPPKNSHQITPGLQQQLSRKPMPLPVPCYDAQSRHIASPQRPMPPPRKQWYDRLADAILGDEETASGSVASRYALICQKCFTHNGLVKESAFDTTRKFAMSSAFAHTV
jgi:endoplasmic reticulum junction formation protein lunapark